MTKKLLLLLGIMNLTLSLSVRAYDFEVDGVYYAILPKEEPEVKVTCQKYENATYISNYAGDVVIPETVTYDGKTYSVTQIDYKAFYECKELTSITIGSNVYLINTNAFYGCIKLQSLSLPQSVTTLGEKAFAECTGLTSISLSSGLTTIEESAFEGCTALTKLTIPSSVTTIDTGAFKNCSGINSLTLGSNIKIIDNNAFENCTGIKTLVIPSKVSTIGTSAFRNCTGIDSLKIGSAVSSIGVAAFRDCSAIKNLNIPNSVKKIDIYAFMNCNAIENVIIGSGVSQIGMLAFRGCPNINNVTINSNAVASKCVQEEKTSNEFSKATNIVSVFGAQVKKYIIGQTVSQIGTYAFYNATDLETIIISNSVTSIGDNAFDGCTNLKKVMIDITDFANQNVIFDTLSKLSKNNVTYTCNNQLISGEFSIPRGSASLGKNIFKGCNAITKIIIPTSVKTIEDGAFINCSNLADITIPSSVMTIGKNVFSGCSSLPVIDDIKYADTYLIEAVNKDLEQYSIKDDCRFIGDKAFKDCASLKDIYIPNSIFSLADSAFMNCTVLKTISFPNTISLIGKDVFTNSNLKYITIDVVDFSSDNIISNQFDTNYTLQYLYKDNVIKDDFCFPEDCKVIGKNALYYCLDITSVTIPNSVKSIGENAFTGCYCLKKVNTLSLDNWMNINFANAQANPLYCAKHLYVNNNELIELTVPDNIKKINDYAFYNCLELQSVTLPSTVNIGNNAFAECNNLTHINVIIKDFANNNKVYSYTEFFEKDLRYYYDDKEIDGYFEIPASCTSIGEHALHGCKTLKGIILPASITSIGSDAFIECYSLKDVYVSWKDSNIFTSKERIFDTKDEKIGKTLYVPVDQISEYQKVEPWKNFQNITEWNEKDINPSDPTAINDADYNHKSRNSIIYNLQGLQIKNPVKGEIYIIDGKKVMAK